MDASSNFPARIDYLWKSLTLNLQLIRRLVYKDVVGRYRGSIFGIVWSFINPLIMLAVYTFVFSFVFKTRWGTGSDSKVEFALALFAGLIVHTLVSECINRAPYQILNNKSYVTKVVFPLETLTWINLFSTLFHTVVSLIVWIIFYIAAYHNFNMTTFYLPIVFLPLLFYTLGLSWFLASLGVYIRDVAQLTGLISTLLLFMSPIFYPITALPLKYQSFLYANPLTFIIEQTREVLMWGNPPNWQGLGITLSISLLVAWAGFFWFQRTRQGFADVL